MALLTRSSTLLNARKYSRALTTHAAPISSILGRKISLFLPNHADNAKGGDAYWNFKPFTVNEHGNKIEYSLAAGPHEGRHAVQKPVYTRVKEGSAETLGWYEETGTVVHLTFHLDTQKVQRFAAVPKWLADTSMSVSAGDNRTTEFREEMARLAAKGPDAPRQMFNDWGYFELLEDQE